MLLMWSWETASQETTRRLCAAFFLMGGGVWERGELCFRVIVKDERHENDEERSELSLQRKHNEKRAQQDVAITSEGPLKGAHEDLLACELG